MKPIKLFIENFMCYERSEIDFTSFNSAVIIGKVDGNDLRSNGVGKTTIFKAIEYVLFNYSSANLEKVIREDSTGCRIIFDFAIENKVYRIIRSRNKKSSISDLSLYERNSVESINAHVWDTDSSLWENKTGRRSQDTEKDIYNLIKLNYKSFISTVHFAQNDMSGLTTSTPEKRKQILKEALQLSIYSKLEKLSKDKYNILVKDYDKNKAIIESLGNCEDDISTIENNLILLNKDIDLNNENLLNNKKQLDECIFEFNKINSELSSFKSKKDSVNQTINSLQSIIDNLNNSIESLSAKKNKVAFQSKEIVSELKKLKTQKQDLHIEENISIEELKKDLDSNNKNLINSTILLNQNVEKINTLNKQLNFFEKNNFETLIDGL